MIGKIIPDALDISRAPIHIRLGEGKGNNKRPTPYIATAKKWQTKLSGLGFKPESKDTGPLENNLQGSDSRSTPGASRSVLDLEKN